MVMFCQVNLMQRRANGTKTLSSKIYKIMYVCIMYVHNIYLVILIQTIIHIYIHIK